MHSEPLVQSSQDGPGLVREDEDSGAEQPHLPSPASAVMWPLSPDRDAAEHADAWATPFHMHCFQPHHHQRAQEALCRNYSPWFASCLAHKAQPELTSALEASKSWRGISGMEVEEGLRNPALSQSAGACGPTMHQAVPTPHHGLEWGPVTLLCMGPFCGKRCV